MKGLELPISMIVIIAVAVLVLVVIAAYFTGSFGRDTETIKYQNAWNTYCGRLVGMGCPANEMVLSDPVGFNLPSGSPATINDVCNKLFNTAAGSSCQARCCTPTA